MCRLTVAAARAHDGRYLPQQVPGMYGLIGKMLVAPGQRDAVIAILLEGTADMPGCRSYVVARDPGLPDAIWITEVWESQEQHRASLALPAVQAAIAQARPHITGFGERFETEPVGGPGS
jgi:quinol monooxygenase YgiN